MRPNESTAAAIVEERLGGEATPRDADGAPDETHDWDVKLSDGRVVALEITAAANTKLVSMEKTAFDNTWEAPSLRAHWMVHVALDADLRVKRLMKGIEPRLKVLQEHCVTEFGRPFSSDEWRHAGEAVVDAVRGITELGCDSAMVWNDPEPGETARLLLTAGGGAGSDFGRLNVVVAECAESNAEKLRAADADERHLFVWLDGSESDAELAMATLPPPETTPMIPAGIDVVWLASPPTGGGADAHFGRLWRLRPPARWQDISSGEGI